MKMFRILKKEVGISLFLDVVVFLCLCFIVFHIIEFYLYPFFYSFGILSAYSGYLIIKIKKNRWVAVNLLFITAFILTLEGFAIFLIHRKDQPSSINHSYGIAGYFTNDDVLGYKPKSGIKTIARKEVEGRLIYEARYTIDENGVRVTGYSKNKEHEHSVVFFGCSFTFGEGVNDEDSLPFLFQTFFPEKFNVYNLGFHGYGPHQMLSFLQNGNLKMIAEKPAFIFHISMPEHVERVMNLVSWDNGYPAYRLVNGRLVSLDKKKAVNEKINKPAIERPWYFKNRILRKSAVMKYLEDRYIERSKLSPRKVERSDVDTFLSVIDESAAIINERYGIPLDIIFWEDSGERSDYIKKELSENKNVRLHLIKNIIPDIHTENGKYVIDEKFEKHPNRYAYLKIAEYLRTFVNMNSVK